MCPHCGYCPACGRSHQTAPAYPIQPIWVWQPPAWVPNTGTITVSVSGDANGTSNTANWSSDSISWTHC